MDFAVFFFQARQIRIQDLSDHGAKAPKKSTFRVNSSVPLTHHDPKDPGVICLVKKRKIHFRILSDLRIQSWIFLKKCTLKKVAYKRANNTED